AQIVSVPGSEALVIRRRLEKHATDPSHAGRPCLLVLGPRLYASGALLSMRRSGREIDASVRASRGPTGRGGNRERPCNDAFRRVLHCVGETDLELFAQCESKCPRVARKGDAEHLGAAKRFAVTVAIPALAEPCDHLLPRGRAKHHAFIDERIHEIGLYAE